MRSCPSSSSRQSAQPFICVIDPATGEAEYCNAGHNPGLVVRASGEVLTLEPLGTVLGILPDLGYKREQARLERGDLIAVYSDGVTEAENPDGEEFGQDRLADILVQTRDRDSGSIIAEVNRAVDTWCAGAPAADDVTLIVVRRTA